MTCILAIRHNGRVVMGCDSLVSNTNGAIRETADSKVVRWGPVLVGIAGRHEIRFGIAAIQDPTEEDLANFGSRVVYEKLIAPLRSWLQRDDLSVSRNGEDRGYRDEFIVAYKGSILHADTGGFVGDFKGETGIAGSGSIEAQSFALGAMGAVRPSDLEQMIPTILREAIEHAARHDDGTGGEIHIFTTDEAEAAHAAESIAGNTACHLEVVV